MRDDCRGTGMMTQRSDAEAMMSRGSGARVAATVRGAARWRGVRAAVMAVALMVAALMGVAPVVAQMPDLRQMSGQPLPSGELPVGTLSVRVVRGSISNNVANQDVRLEGGGPARTIRTDASGRAVFSGLASGTIWRAVTTVDGERLESQAIEMPASGGLRVLLAAGLQAGAGAPAAGGATSGAPSAQPGQPGSGSMPGAPSPGTPPFAGGAGAGAGPGAGAGAGAPAAPSTPAVPGTVTFGSQSRIVIELAEGSIEVYGLFDIVNLGAAPVMPAAPIVFEAPAEASNTNVLEGSSPQAKADGRKVTVSGPFVPGNTSLQIAYRVRYEGDTVHLAQVMPIGLPQTTVIVRKFGALQASLTGMVGQREVPLEGRAYLVLNGKAVAAGDAIQLTLSGLPHRAAWPKNVALALAALVLIAGIVLAFAPRSAAIGEDVSDLRARRAERFEQLVSVDRALRDRPADTAAVRDGRQARRAALVAEVEELDEALASVTPEAPAGGAGRPAAEGAERLGARPAVR